MIHVNFELGEQHARALVRILRHLSAQAVCDRMDSDQERFDLVVALERLRMALEKSEPGSRAQDQ